MLCGNYILSNRSEWTFYFLSSVQFNFTIGEGKKVLDYRKSLLKTAIPTFLKPPLNEKERITLKLEKLGFEKIKHINTTSKGNTFVAFYKNKKVFIKQAYANELIDKLGRSAADRLKNEYYYLKKIHNIINSVKPILLKEYTNESILVEEFVYGFSLSEYFRTGKYYDADRNQRNIFIVKIIDYLLSDIKKLHNNGIIFRDVSPSNIIVNNDIPILIDYELANQFSNLKAYGGATPGFFSIREKGIRRWSTQRDVYGLGALIFYLTTTVKPIYQEDLISSKKQREKLEKIAIAINEKNSRILQLSFLGIEMMYHCEKELSYFIKKFYLIKNFTLNMPLNEPIISNTINLNLKAYLKERAKKIVITNNKVTNRIDVLRKTQIISLDGGLVADLMLLKNQAYSNKKYSYNKMTKLLNTINYAYDYIPHYNVHNLITGDVGLLYCIDWYNKFYSNIKYSDLREKIIISLENTDFEKYYTSFLYGNCGIGYMLCKAYHLSKDKRLLKIINTLINTVYKRIEVRDGKIIDINAGNANYKLNNKILDLGYGSVGVGIFFCEYLKIMDNKKILKITDMIYEQINMKKNYKNGYIYWQMSNFDNHHYPLLFSGTAGIGVFLISYKRLTKKHINNIDNILGLINHTLLNLNIVFTANLLQGAAGILFFSKYYEKGKELESKYRKIIYAMSSKKGAYRYWTDPSRYNRRDDSFLTGTPGIYYVLTMSKERGLRE